MKKSKALLLFILSLLIIICTVACNDDDTKGNGESDYVYILSDSGEISITRYNSDKSVVEIPSMIDGHPVTSISTKAFFMNKTVTEIVIPEGVTTIGSSAFEACSSLRRITVPDTLTSIGDMAFNNCSKLENIILNGNSNLKQIGKDAFLHCNSLKTNTYGNAIYLPSKDNNYAILISAASTNISDVQIHQDTVIIVANAFKECKSITEITIPENIKYIGDGAFYGCTNLDMIYYNAKRVTDFLPGSGIFQLVATTSTTMTLQVGNQVERIPAYLFDSSIRFRILRFDEGSICTEIGKAAFAGTSLDDLVIPPSIKVIEDMAFYNCQVLESVKLDATNLSDFSENNQIFTDAGKLSQNITVTFGRTAERIPANFLRTLNNITVIKFENNDITKSFGENAFYGCNTIRQVDATSRKGWCEATFENEFSNPLRYGNAVLRFNGNSVTQGFIMTEDIDFISEYAFVGYRNLLQVIIPSSVQYIGVNAFYGVENLSTIYWSGDKESWDALDIRSGNDVTTTANKIFYWARELGRPTVPGNYWYLNEQTGTPVFWN